MVAAPVMLIPKEVGLSTGWSPYIKKIISFYNIHTGESLNRCVYWIEGEYQPEALKELQHHFRDYRNNQELPLDPKLLDILFEIQTRLHTNKPFHLVSGYRSPATNASLCAVSDGVVQNSQHLYGKAADIYLEGIRLKDIQRAARDVKMGGVGGYRQFVHVDTARVRYWGAI